MSYTLTSLAPLALYPEVKLDLGHSPELMSGSGPSAELAAGTLNASYASDTPGSMGWARVRRVAARPPRLSLYCYRQQAGTPSYA